MWKDPFETVEAWIREKWWGLREGRGLGDGGPGIDVSGEGVWIPMGGEALVRLVV